MFILYLKDDHGNVVAQFSSDTEILADGFPDGWTIDRENA